MGRSFLVAEDRTGGADVAMISTRLWHRRFGSDPAILGRTATLGGTPYTIVGVLPPRFTFPLPATRRRNDFYGAGEFSSELGETFRR